MDLVKILAPSNPATAKLISDYTTKHVQFTKDLADTKVLAESKVQESILTQKKAMYYDFSVGILEISLVMSSLFFISRKKFFPIFGAVAGLLGAMVGLLGLLL